MTTLKTILRNQLMTRAPGLLYRYPKIALAPERLYVYLDELWKQREADGAVVEVGVWLGGTAAIASSMLERMGHPCEYVGIDTFDGFDEEQFRQDAEKLGVPPAHADMFDGNSKDVVSSLLKQWNAPSTVRLVKGDIARVSADELPKRIKVCLLDVDLEVPIYEGLKRLLPHMAAGGVILVDDCAAETSWKGARVGYRRFVTEAAVAEDYRYGFGIVRIGERDGVPV